MKAYLDNNATTPMDSRVLDAMVVAYRDWFGNPSSLHSFGREVAGHVDEARQKIAELMGVSAEEIIFTGSGSEADNAALRGIVAASGKKNPHIITTEIEHPAVYVTARALAECEGARVTYLPVSGDGTLDPDAVRKAIDADTAIVSVMHVNNEVGAIQPIHEIAQICAEKDVPFHSDCVQSVGRIGVDLGELGVDLASVAAHKFNGPKGIGCLYVRGGTRIKPFVTGGGQEDGRRAGTHNSPGIVGMARALELAVNELDATTEKVRGLRDRFESAVLAAVPDSKVNGAGARRVPNTCNLAFKGIESEALLIKLDLAGIAASAGSACSTGSATASHVLMAMGLTHREAASSIRFFVRQIQHRRRSRLCARGHPQGGGGIAQNFDQRLKKSQKKKRLL